jgi:hypothetical protein
MGCWRRTFFLGKICCCHDQDCTAPRTSYLNQTTFTNEGAWLKLRVEVRCLFDYKVLVHIKIMPSYKREHISSSINQISYSFHSVDIVLSHCRLMLKLSNSSLFIIVELPSVIFEKDFLIVTLVTWRLVLRSQSLEN